MEPYSVERRRVGRVVDKKPLTLAIVGCCVGCIPLLGSLVGLILCIIAYATGNAASRPDARNRALAVAMVVERGESGGGTTAPKVCAVLKAAFNGPDGEEAGDVE